jgi:hypothetical protein
LMHYGKDHREGIEELGRISLNGGSNWKKIVHFLLGWKWESKVMQWNFQGHGSECDYPSNWNYMALFFWINKWWKHSCMYVGMYVCMCVSELVCACTILFLVLKEKLFAYMCKVLPRKLLNTWNLTHSVHKAIWLNI